MPITNVVAKKDLLPVFKIGDKAKIVPILYEEDTVICNEIYGVFENGELVKFAEAWDHGKGKDIRLVFDKAIAPKGSYKDSYIELEDGRQYPSSLVRRYEDYFDKIKNKQL